MLEKKPPTRCPEVENTIPTGARADVKRLATPKENYWSKATKIISISAVSMMASVLRVFIAKPSVIWRIE